jgi:hypothetical protein
MRGGSPACSPGVITVGNVWTGDPSLGYVQQKASSSESGPRVDIWAPGTNIVSAMPNTNAFGCTAISNPFAVNINGLLHHTNSTGVLISPNPVFDALRIALNTNEDYPQVIIFNAAGVKIYENKTFLNNTLVVDTKTFSAGVYIVSVQTTSGVYNQRLSVIK